MTDKEPKVSIVLLSKGNCNGHTDVRTIQIYAKIVDQKLIADMDSLAKSYKKRRTLKRSNMKTGYIRFSKTNSIEVNLVNSTIWLTANQIADFFGVSVSTVNKHLKEIFKDNLLREYEVVKEYRDTCSNHGDTSNTK